MHDLRPDEPRSPGVRTSSAPDQAPPARANPDPVGAEWGLHNPVEAAVQLTVSLDDDGVTITAGDVHPVNLDDACRHCGDLLLRLHRALAAADAEGC